jgi:hypothetical protein
MLLRFYKRCCCYSASMRRGCKFATATATVTSKRTASWGDGDMCCRRPFLVQYRGIRRIEAGRRDAPLVSADLRATKLNVAQIRRP